MTTVNMPTRSPYFQISWVSCCIFTLFVACTPTAEPVIDSNTKSQVVVESEANKSFHSQEQSEQTKQALLELSTVQMELAMMALSQPISESTRQLAEETYREQQIQLDEMLNQVDVEHADAEIVWSDRGVALYNQLNGLRLAEFEATYRIISDSLNRENAKWRGVYHTNEMVVRTQTNESDPS